LPLFSIKKNKKINLIEKKNKLYNNNNGAEAEKNKMDYEKIQDTVKNKIRKIIKDQFSNKKEFAQLVGIDKTTIYQAIDTPSKRDFTLHHLFLIARSLKVPLYNLLFEGHLIPEQDVQGMLKKVHEFKDKFQMVPEIEPVACGNLSHLAGNHIIDYRVFNRLYLKDTFKPFITRASGDSMHPTISEGDLVLFDRNPDKLINPTDENIYLANTTPFSEDISLTIKRVLVKKNTLWLLPDNPGYRAQEIEMDEKSSPVQYILGIAIWVGKELIK
jgi:SOS-response transcriptional repressor LexA